VEPNLRQSNVYIRGRAQNYPEHNQAVLRQQELPEVGMLLNRKTKELMSALFAVEKLQVHDFFPSPIGKTIAVKSPSAPTIRLQQVRKIRMRIGRIPE
jgi:hypothetical protein